MAVRENRPVAFPLAIYVALFILCECAIFHRAYAQKPTDTRQSTTPSEQTASDISDQSIEATDRPESKQKVEQTNDSAQPKDPVFQEQTTPPPQPTLAEKKSPLLKRSEKESTSKQIQSSQPPPEPVTEKRSPPPDVQYIWVPGFWYWYDAQYVWISGRWIAPRHGYVFVRPRWARRAGVWVFLPGGWAVVGSTSIVYPLDMGIYIRPWLRSHRYHRHHRSYIRRPHFRGRTFRPPRGHRPRARITTRSATRPRSRARHR